MERYDFVYSDSPIYDINRDVPACDTEKDDTTKELNGDSTTSITESKHVRKQSTLSSEPMSPASCPTKELTGTFTVSTSGLEFSKCSRKCRQLAFEQGTPMNLKEKYVHLYTAISSDEMLTDRHIDAASQLLSGQFPDFQGLSTPVHTWANFVISCVQLFCSCSWSFLHTISHCPAFYHWLTMMYECLIVST